MRGTWVAQWVEHLTSAQVMISLLMSSSPASGSVLTAQSLEPASDSVSPSLSVPPLLTLCLCLKNKWTLKKRSNNLEKPRGSIFPTLFIKPFSILHPFGDGGLSAACRLFFSQAIKIEKKNPREFKFGFYSTDIFLRCCWGIKGMIKGKFPHQRGTCP